MSTSTLAGLALIALPIAFNAAFVLLGMRFDYPDILRKPTAEVLERFREGGDALLLLWWAFALTAVLFAPVAVLFALAVPDANGTLLAVATTIGVLASIVQLLGLIRWPLLVPYLARTIAEPDASPARGSVVPFAYVAWSLWLIATGVALIARGVQQAGELGGGIQPPLTRAGGTARWCASAITARG